MSLKTYERDAFASDRPWPLYRYAADGTLDKEATTFRPGDWVAHAWGGGTGRGVVIGVTQDEVAVLWSDEPQSGFDKFAFPIIRQVSPRLTANSIGSIQPMTAPTGGIFYMDYTYGSGSQVAEPPPQPTHDRSAKKRAHRRP